MMDLTDDLGGSHSMSGSHKRKHEENSDESTSTAPGKHSSRTDAMDVVGDDSEDQVPPLPALKHSNGPNKPHFAIRHLGDSDSDGSALEDYSPRSERTRTTNTRDEISPQNSRSLFTQSHRPSLKAPSSDHFGALLQAIHSVEAEQTVGPDGEHMSKRMRLNSDPVLPSFSSLIHSPLTGDLQVQQQQLQQQQQQQPAPYQRTPP